MAVSSRQTLKIKHSSFTSDYRVLKEVLGFGVNGPVSKCMRLEDEQIFAVKLLEANEKAKREVTLHHSMSDCPYIVNLVDVYQNQNKETKKHYLLLVLEYLPGGELFHRITRSSHFTEKEAACYAYQISSALLYLHRRHIAHRDLKPENLLLTEDGKLKLTDFGFARISKQSNTIKTPNFTPYYAAPEILSCQMHDKSVDLWSLGIVIYIMLAGRPPFYSKAGKPLTPGMKQDIIDGNYEFPVSEWKDVSSTARDLIHHLLRTDPKDRYTIEDVMSHPWIKRHQEIPSTPLHNDVFLSDHELRVINAGIRVGLQEMSREYASSADDGDGDDTTFTIKSLETANNRLLKSRRAKKTSSCERPLIPEHV